MPIKGNSVTSHQINNSPIPRSDFSAKNLGEGRIRGLDGMRAGSVLLVLLSHFGFEKVIPGALGVTIFFFISGFLITILLLREHQKYGKIEIMNFYKRRQIRLLPELLFYIIISGFIGVIYVGLPRVQDYLSSVFYYANYYHLYQIYTSGIIDFRWPHFWTLAVEQHFYLTFPLIFVAFITNPKRLIIFLISLCVAVFVWRGIIIISGGSSRYTYEASDARIDSIVYGCITAVLLWFGTINVGRFGLWLIGAGASLLVATLIIRSPFFRDVIRYSMQGLALMLIFLGLYASKKGEFILRILESAPLVWVGRMAYGAYLWHFDFLVVVQSFKLEGSFETHPIYTVFLASILSVATFVMAYASFRLVFTPAQKIFNHRLF
jgi:peptidoglycan/LPS O-acetylase OafA/YrhL